MDQETSDLRHQLLRERDLRIGLEAAQTVLEDDLAQLRKQLSAAAGLLAKRDALLVRREGELAAHAERMQWLERRVDVLVASRSYRLGRFLLKPAGAARRRRSSEA